MKDFVFANESHDWMQYFNPVYHFPSATENSKLLSLRRTQQNLYYEASEYSRFLLYSIDSLDSDRTPCKERKT